MGESKRWRRWPWVLGGIVVVLAVGAALFQWDWLIPLVDARASAALGRPVKVAHLHVRLGRVPRVVADGVVIGNPPDWPGGGDFATAEHLTIDADAMAYLRGRQIVLPLIELDQPVVDAQQLQDGKANWVLGSASSGGTASNADEGNGLQIGKLVINEGQVHARSAKMAADFQVQVATRSGGEDSKDQIVATAKGTYAKQPITAEFVGGALLSLRDASQPYPIDLKLANGPTRASALGTVANPLNFAGADVTLDIAGPDMALLQPLSGIAFPKTPPHHLSGKLDYANGVVRFRDFAGRVGSSDLNGNLEVDTKPHERPVLTADLNSKLVDLKDLGGFIGAEPGDADKGTKRPTPSDGRVLPNDPLNLPKLNAMDVHLKYRANRIEGRHQPLDNMRADLDIVNGNVALHPISFGIGRGQISGNIEVAERPPAVHAKATID
ncbi:MAG: AsmA family protein, partial [Acetobacteraceae bacterium]|nr:AsmA family protein [Acetobacteraceae bacterium]